MSGSIYLAASGAILQQRKTEIIANNLANINTPGYKEDLPIFTLQNQSEETVQDQISDNSSIRQKISPYTPPFGVRTDFSSGPIKATGNALDLALSGDGFFAIQTADGIRYTRQGNFRLDQDGVLITQNGDNVLGQGNEIVIDGQQVAVGLDGTVEVDGEVVDQIRLVRFNDPKLLKKIGDTLFAPADGFGAEIEEGGEDTTINQGYIELSNVNAIRSMTDMIEALRVSEAYQKVIHASDESLSKTINDVPSA